MRTPLRTMMWIAIVVGLFLAVGISVEWFRRWDLQKLAKELGGTFDAGGLLTGASMPEAAAFHHP